MRLINQMDLKNTYHILQPSLQNDNTSTNAKQLPIFFVLVQHISIRTRPVARHSKCVLQFPHLNLRDLSVINEDNLSSWKKISEQQRVNHNSSPQFRLSHTIPHLSHTARSSVRTLVLRASFREISLVRVTRVNIQSARPTKKFASLPTRIFFQMVISRFSFLASTRVAA